MGLKKFFWVLLGSVWFVQMWAQKDTLELVPAYIPLWVTAQPSSVKNNPLSILTMPIFVHKGYAEVRYNYDFNQTFGIYAGRVFTKTKKSTHFFIPQIGALYGAVKGGSVQLYYRYVHPKVEINFQNQYSFALDRKFNFYYNWSDVQYSVRPWFRVGTSVQYYTDKLVKTTDVGIFVGFLIKDWTFAAYSFNFYDANTHYLIFVVQKSILIGLKTKQRSEGKKS